MENLNKDLISTYNAYDSFEKPIYFFIQFKTFPSAIELDLFLEESKENMQRVCDIINIQKKEFNLIYKNWNTKDDKDASISGDYISEYFYQSINKALTICFSLSNNRLRASFLFDGNDLETERWILKLNHKIRVELGEPKKATFKVLTRGNSGFYTEEVNTKEFTLDIEKSYNDAFKESHEIIQQSMSEDKAGLILLHGTPGTGKTSYIKYLINTFQDKTFIFIQNEFVQELLNPNFVSFLLDNKNAILIIEDAEKVIMSREGNNENSVVSTILQLTDGLFSDYLNIKIICTFNTSIEKIDKALLRKGRMIAYHDFKPLSKEKSNQLLIEKGLDAQNKEMTLADIHNFKKKEFNQENSKNIGFGV
ncbi:MAG: AAA family ATPase [Flavobacteriales bacterium]